MVNILCFIASGLVSILSAKNHPGADFQTAVRVGKSVHRGVCVITTVPMTQPAAESSSH